MKSNYIIFLLVYLGLFYSCQKDNVLPKIELAKYDTIKPFPYLPVYPGSYWIYDNGDSVYTDPDYKLNSYYLDYAKLVGSDTVYVPCWRQGFWGQNVYVYGYQIPSMNSVGLSQIISENEGEQWQVWTDQRVIQSRAVTFKKDTSITLNNEVYDSVLIVDYYSGPANLDILFEHNTRIYYAKNIGLIKVDRNIGYASDTLVLETVNYLTKYFINK